MLHHEWDSDVFYKDEGGKDKCLRARVKLCDHNGEVVRGTHLSLRLRLLYDDDANNVVLRQEETLRLLGSSKHFIDPENGEAVIKFRIEDVSKNHQGLKFKLEVFPDVRRSVDVAPDISPGIVVRSKRNKRLTSPGRRKVGHFDVPVPFEEAFPQLHPNIQSPISQQDDSATKRLDRRNVNTRDAINEVVAWSKDVAKILPSLKWNLVSRYWKFCCLCSCTRYETNSSRLNRLDIVRMQMGRQTTQNPTISCLIQMIVFQGKNI